MATADEELLDFLPLYPDDDEESILERMRVWANEGLDPAIDTDAWVDTSEGSHWHACVMPTVRELARLYDLAGTEVPASGFPVWAWADYLDDHAEVQDIVRLPATPAAGVATFRGPEGTLIATGTTVSVEVVTEDAAVPEFEVTAGGVIPAPIAPAVVGVLSVPISATEDGVLGNVAAGAITEFSTPPPEPTVTVTNADPTFGGTEAESDEGLRERVLGAFTGQGAGNKRDYERWARAWAGVGRVTVIPLWNGPGTVKVIVTDANGDPVTPETVAGLQADLDPVPGHAEGRAPVSANVTVETATARPIEVVALIEFEPGYSLDGDAGTVALRTMVEDALRQYIERVEPGGEVVIAKVRGVIVTVPGVHDVGAVTIEGGAVNVAIDDDPPEVPTLPVPTLTEGAV
jgi:uncharacterized phage protein gp47/JayE